METLYQELSEYIERQELQNNISVTKDGGRIFISFSQVVFFDGDSPVLKKEAEPVLDELCLLFDEVKESIDELRVLGHTAQEYPNKPNRVRADRTLASMRATNVVIYLQEHSTMDPAKLVSEGLGQWRPVDTNETSEGRARNRRVEMIVSGRNLEQELQSGIAHFETT